MLQRCGLIAGDRVVVAIVAARSVSGSASPATWHARSPGQCEMKLPAFAGEQIVVEGLAKQRVAEQTVLRPRRRTRTCSATASRSATWSGIMFDPGDLGDRRFVEPPSDGDRPRRALGVGWETLDPQDERVAQALRGGAAAVQPGGEQLFGVERVALAAREQSLHEPGLGGRAEDVRQRLGQLVAVEWRQVDAARPIQALQLGDQWAQRMAAVATRRCGR